MAVEHDYFGLIESDESGGLYWSETADVGDQTVDISLSVPGGSAVTDEGLDTAAAIVTSLDGLDLRAREAMLSEVDDSSSDVTQFVSTTVEELGEDLTELLVDHSGDVDVDIIRSLQLIRVALHPHQTGEGVPFVSMEFALDPDNSDLALLVGLSQRGESVSVELVE